MSNDSGIDQDELHFPEMVKSNFSFLEKRGFKLEEESKICVRYCSAKVTISIYFENYFEISIYFSRSGFEGHSFSHNEILFWAVQTGRIKEMPEWGKCQASTPEAVEHVLAKIAMFVSSYAEAILECDDTVYENLERNRSIVSAQYAKERKVANNRKEAESAWRLQDHEVVAELYGEVEDNITSSEKMKLSYARKQLASAGRKS
jgi:hypothetical protein